MENKFYQMLTATISHELRTPLNQLVNLIESFEPYIIGNNDAIQILKILKTSSQ